MKIDYALSEFHNNLSGLLKVLGELAAVKEPESGSEIALLLNESKRGEDDVTSAGQEVRRISAEVRRYLESQHSKRLSDFNKKFQEFLTQKLSAEGMALFLRDLIQEHKIPVKASARLLGLMKHEKQMRDIEGTQFFDDFRAYSDEVKESLFRDDAERALDLRVNRFGILKKLSALELTHDQWLDFKNRIAEFFPDMEAAEQNEEYFLADALRRHMAFYDNAERRDGVFFENLTEAMAKHSAETSILIAGGFHAKGLTERFEKENISYALLVPHMTAVPEDSPYKEHMKGNVSWKHYLRVEDNKIDLYKAFVRGTRDRLLAMSGTEPGKILKRWRDQILRDLAERGGLERAGDYTALIDEAAGKGDDWTAAARQFLDGLIELDAKHELTRQNMLQLFQPATMKEVFLVIAPAAKLGPAFRVTDSGVQSRGFYQPPDIPGLLSEQGSPERVQEDTGKSDRSELRETLDDVEARIRTLRADIQSDGLTDETIENRLQLFEDIIQTLKRISAEARAIGGDTEEALLGSYEQLYLATNAFSEALPQGPEGILFYGINKSAIDKVAEIRVESEAKIAEISGRLGDTQEAAEARETQLRKRLEGLNLSDLLRRRIELIDSLDNIRLALLDRVERQPELSRIFGPSWTPDDFLSQNVAIDESLRNLQSEFRRDESVLNITQEIIESKLNQRNREVDRDFEINLADIRSAPGSFDARSAEETLPQLAGEILRLRAAIQSLVRFVDSTIGELGSARAITEPDRAATARLKLADALTKLNQAVEDASTLSRRAAQITGEPSQLKPRADLSQEVQELHDSEIERADRDIESDWTYVLERRDDLLTLRSDALTKLEEKRKAAVAYLEYTQDLRNRYSQHILRDESAAIAAGEDAAVQSQLLAQLERMLAHLEQSADELEKQRSYLTGKQLEEATALIDDIRGLRIPEQSEPLSDFAFKSYDFSKAMLKANFMNAYSFAPLRFRALNFDFDATFASQYEGLLVTRRRIAKQLVDRFGVTITDTGDIVQGLDSTIDDLSAYEDLTLLYEMLEGFIKSSRAAYDRHNVNQERQFLLRALRTRNDVAFSRVSGELVASPLVTIDELGEEVDAEAYEAQFSAREQEIRGREVDSTLPGLEEEARSLGDLIDRFNYLTLENKRGSLERSIEFAESRDSDLDENQIEALQINLENNRRLLDAVNFRLQDVRYDPFRPSQRSELRALDSLLLVTESVPGYLRVNFDAATTPLHSSGTLASFRHRIQKTGETDSKTIVAAGERGVATVIKVLRSSVFYVVVDGEVYAYDPKQPRSWTALPRNEFDSKSVIVDEGSRSIGFTFSPDGTVDLVNLTQPGGRGAEFFTQAVYQEYKVSLPSEAVAYARETLSAEPYQERGILGEGARTVIAPAGEENTAIVVRIRDPQLEPTSTFMVVRGEVFNFNFTTGKWFILPQAATTSFGGEKTVEDETTFVSFPIGEYQYAFFIKSNGEVTVFNKGQKDVELAIKKTEFPVRSELRTGELSLVDRSVRVHPLDTRDSAEGAPLALEEAALVRQRIERLSSRAQDLQHDEMRLYLEGILAETNVEKNIRKDRLESAFGTAGRNGIVLLHETLIGAAVAAEYALQAPDLSPALRAYHEGVLKLLDATLAHEFQHQIDFIHPDRFEGLSGALQTNALERSAIITETVYTGGVVISSDDGNFVAIAHYKSADGTVRRVAHTTAASRLTPSEREWSLPADTGKLYEDYRALAYVRSELRTLELEGNEVEMIGLSGILGALELVIGSEVADDADGRERLLDEVSQFVLSTNVVRDGALFLKLLDAYDAALVGQGIQRGDVLAYAVPIATYKAALAALKTDIERAVKVEPQDAVEFSGVEERFLAEQVIPQLVSLVEDLNDIDDLEYLLEQTINVWRPLIFRKDDRALHDKVQAIYVAAIEKQAAQTSPTFTVQDFYSNRLPLAIYKAVVRDFTASLQSSVAAPAEQPVGEPMAPSVFDSAEQEFLRRNILPQLTSFRDDLDGYTEDDRDYTLEQIIRLLWRPLSYRQDNNLLSEKATDLYTATIDRLGTAATPPFARDDVYANRISFAAYKEVLREFIRALDAQVGFRSELRDGSEESAEAKEARYLAVPRSFNKSRPHLDPEAIGPEGRIESKFFNVETFGGSNEDRSQYSYETRVFRAEEIGRVVSTELSMRFVHFPGGVDAISPEAALDGGVVVGARSPKFRLEVYLKDREGIQDELDKKRKGKEGFWRGAIDLQENVPVAVYRGELDPDTVDLDNTDFLMDEEEVIRIRRYRAALREFIKREDVPKHLRIDTRAAIVFTWKENGLIKNYYLPDVIDASSEESTGETSTRLLRISRSHATDPDAAARPTFYRDDTDALVEDGAGEEVWYQNGDRMEGFKRPGDMTIMATEEGGQDFIVIRKTGAINSVSVEVESPQTANRRGEGSSEVEFSDADASLRMSRTNINASIFLAQGDNVIDPNGYDMAFQYEEPFRVYYKDGGQDKVELFDISDGRLRHYEDPVREVGFLNVEPSNFYHGPNFDVQLVGSFVQVTNRSQNEIKVRRRSADRKRSELRTEPAEGTAPEVLETAQDVALHFARYGSNSPVERRLALVSAIEKLNGKTTIPAFVAVVSKFIEEIDSGMALLDKIASDVDQAAMAEQFRNFASLVARYSLTNFNPDQNVTIALKLNSEDEGGAFLKNVAENLLKVSDFVDSLIVTGAEARVGDELLSLQDKTEINLRIERNLQRVRPSSLYRQTQLPFIANVGADLTSSNPITLGIGILAGEENEHAIVENPFVGASTSLLQLVAAIKLAQDSEEAPIRLTAEEIKEFSGRLVSDLLKGIIKEADLKLDSRYSDAIQFENGNIVVSRFAVSFIMDKLTDDAVKAAA
ncbi:MAG: hypothetical protein Q8R76_06545 [Candidatus Omnitrophota bacterium]|nr:hypothetical protein [Candidatus Omnitrophota bacterium]